MARYGWRPGDMTVAEGQSTRGPMPGGHIEVAEIAGDSASRPLVLLHEGLGSIGLWREFPGGDRTTRDHLLAVRARSVRSAERTSHGELLSRGGARGAS